jgi:hypothetical protein
MPHFTLDEIRKSKVGQLPENARALGATETPKRKQSPAPALERNPSAMKKDYRIWTDGEIAYLRQLFGNPSKPSNINLAAVHLGRSFFSVALKLSRLGMGNFKRPKRPEVIEKRCATNRQLWAEMSLEERRIKVAHLLPYCGKGFLGKHFTEEQKAESSARRKAYLAANGHPRGMLGKHHSEETKAAISALNSGRKVPRERTIRQMKTCLAKYGTLQSCRPVSWKQGWRQIGPKRIYARSRWEANYARYLQFLLDHNEILKWEHEPETFWFEKVKRGAVSYLPDFRITHLGGSIEYVEVKGWMDARSKTKIRRMAKYFPNIWLKVIREDWFRSNGRKMQGLIPGWETNKSPAIRESSGTTTSSPSRGRKEH